MWCRTFSIKMCSQAKRFSFNREFKMSYSMDFRRRVIARVQSGVTIQNP